MTTCESINKAFSDVTLKLKEQEGYYYQEVVCEWQSLHNDFAIWILLHKDYNIHISHEAIFNIISPYFEIVKPNIFNVFYRFLTEDLEVSIDNLIGNDEIINACNNPSFGKHPQTNLRKQRSIFRSNLSEVKLVIPNR